MREKKSFGILKRLFYIILPLLAIGITIGVYSKNKLIEVKKQKGCFSLDNEFAEISFPVEQKSIKFVTLGGLGTDADNQVLVAKAIKKVCQKQGCDFGVLLGDQFTSPTVQSVFDPEFKRKFDDIYMDLKIPFFPVIGDQDLQSSYKSQIYYSLISDKWKMPNLDYHFTTTPALFNAVNSNCSLYSMPKLFENLNIKERPWNIVFAHHPIFSNGTNGDRGLIERVAWQTFFNESVDFYISGHDSQLEHLSVAKENTQYIVSGLGDDNYQESKRKDQPKKSKSISHFKHEEKGFVWFHLTEQRALVKFYDSSAKVIYQFRKMKK